MILPPKKIPQAAYKADFCQPWQHGANSTDYVGNCNTQLTALILSAIATDS